jgi:TonB family protein
MAQKFALPDLRTERVKRLGSAFAVSILAHALLLSWPVSLPAAGLMGEQPSTLQRSAPRALTVRLNSEVEVSRPAPVVEIPPEPPLEQAPLVVASAEKPREASQPGAQNAIPLVGYYPAEKLSKMPEAVSIFRVEPPAGGDTGLVGKVTIRLWIGADGAIDRVRVVDNGLPQAYADAASAAFERMRFEPGQIGGVPVKSWVEVVIEYSDFRDPPDGEASLSK